MKGRLDHPCAAPGCPIPIGSDLLMCVTHWHGVPRELRHEVYRAWRAWRANPTDVTALRAYGAARDAAVASVTP